MAVLWLTPVFCQEMPVPVNIQYELLAKILTYEKNLINKTELSIGVVFQEKFRKSLNAKNDLMEAARRSDNTGDNPFVMKFIPIEISQKQDLEEALLDMDLNAVYITPLRAIALEGIMNYTRKSGTLSLTGIPEYVENGLTLGFGSRGGKAVIIINLKASRLETVHFSSSLLKLAHVID